MISAFNILSCTLIFYLLIIVYQNITPLYIVLPLTMSLSYIGQNCMFYCCILTTTSLLQCCKSAINKPSPESSTPQSRTLWPAWLFCDGAAPVERPARQSAAYRLI